MDFDLAAWRHARVRAFDAWLAPRLDGAWPPAFSEPLRYPVFGGGKRVRPLLAIAAYEAVGGGPKERVWPGAAAVELVHSYSLVHDDLPCMDDDDERRGRPTVHVAFGEATAVLVGDALLTHAFELLCDAPLPPTAVVASVRALARAAGYRGMIGGQVADLELRGQAVDLDALQRTHALKTGALIRAACALGGLAGGASPDALRRLDAYGEAVGLAFQLADDLLDADEDAGEDGPPSYVKALGADETRRRARAAAARAADAVRDLRAPDALRALARYSVERSH